MRDGVAIFKAGVPAVVVVHTNFESAARAQAKIQGAADLHFLVIPHNSVNVSKEQHDAEEAEKAGIASEKLREMIEHRE